LRSSTFFGSPERLILAQMKALRGRVDAEVAVLPDGPDDFARAVEAEGFVCHRLTGGARAQARAVKRLLREKGHDVLCTHDYKSNVLGFWAARGTRARQAAVFHGRTSHDFKGRIYEALDDRVLRKLPAVVMVSEATRTKLPGLNQARVIRNAFDPSVMAAPGGRDLRKEFGWGEEAVVFGTAGRLSREKGHALLIDAFKELAARRPEARLVIAGDGPLREDLQRQIDAAGLSPKARLAGFMKDVGSLYEAVDVFVLPSHTEGLPLVLLEAAHHGKPAVATAVGGVGEVVQNGASGLLVPAGDARALARAMTEMAENPATRASMGLRAAKIVATEFSVGPYAEKYWALYQELAASKALWIAWEGHRRSREIAPAVGATLVELTMKASRLVKHPALLWRTFEVLNRERPDILFVQCPSVFLGAWAVILKKFFGYTLAVDAHNEAVKPFNYAGGWYEALLNFIHRGADASIVTNARLKSLTEKRGGRAVILPDRIPTLEPGAMGSGATPKIVFICSFAPDEPYAEVIEAARRLGDGVTVFITGNKAKADPTVLAQAPANVRFTGFLSEHDYVALIQEADALVDLTLMEDCLVCGAYEAVAVEKPLVTSDTAALREHFRRGTLYAKPDAAALAAAMKEALEKRAVLSNEMRLLKNELTTSWNVQKEELMTSLRRQPPCAA